MADFSPRAMISVSSSVAGLTAATSSGGATAIATDFGRYSGFRVLNTTNRDIVIRTSGVDWGYVQTGTAVAYNFGSSGKWSLEDSDLSVYSIGGAISTGAVIVCDFF